MNWENGYFQPNIPPEDIGTLETTMPAKEPHYTIRYTLANKRAIREMGVAVRFINEQADGQEWNEEAQRARRAVAYALRHMKPEVRETE